MLVSIEKFHGGWSWCSPWHQQEVSFRHGVCCNCQQVKCSLSYLVAQIQSSDQCSQDLFVTDSTLSTVALWPAGTPEWSSRHPMKSWLTALEFALWQHCRNIMRLKKKTHFICLNVLVVYPVDAPDRPSVHIFFWCRWTTTCLTRLRCTEMVCQKGTWH